MFLNRTSRSYVAILFLVFLCDLDFLTCWGAVAFFCCLPDLVVCLVFVVFCSSLRVFLLEIVLGDLCAFCFCFFFAFSVVFFSCFSLIGCLGVMMFNLQCSWFCVCLGCVCV